MKKKEKKEFSYDIYFEPKDFFPKEDLKKYKLGRYNDENAKEPKKEKKTK